MQKKNAKEICKLTNAVLAKCVRLLEEMRRFTFLLLPSHHPPPPLGNTNNPQHNPNQVAQIMGREEGWRGMRPKKRGNLRSVVIFGVILPFYKGKKWVNIFPNAFGHPGGGGLLVSLTKDFLFFQTPSQRGLGGYGFKFLLQPLILLRLRNTRQKDLQLSDSDLIVGEESFRGVNQICPDFEGRANRK